MLSNIKKIFIKIQKKMLSLKLMNFSPKKFLHKKNILNLSKKIC